MSVNRHIIVILLQLQGRVRQQATITIFILIKTRCGQDFYEPFKVTLKRPSFVYVATTSCKNFRREIC